MDELFLHDQNDNAADCRYSIQTDAGGVLFLFNACDITAREVFETFKSGRARAQEWQDISTAPKDNSLVGRRYLFGRWNERRFDWIVSGFFDANGAPWHDGKRMEAFGLHMPTHFIGYDRWSMPPTAPLIADDRADDKERL